ncbi:hypothetical protein ASC77_09820 [Nocardioides sp. Root1257]|uniref:hypothetical protein n=1 Tax=unclassified Nocardioides TaxID=2615069 RepID=UPI0006F8CD4D|nr:MULTISPECIES: hypothetical protein [unclassified Nocardioides]KQW48999.1 hypothetical protein ASC77_09820 [Nocardioides sp. Root1257]KRC48173.1 hypothetical protein ASE24_09825 [Nocardioides sp. Root224]
MTLTDTSTDRSSTRTTGLDVTRLSAWCGLAFTISQLTVMVCMSIFVLPHGGRPGMDPLTWGQKVLAHEDAFRIGNYVFMVAGVLLLGFLGAVNVRLRRADDTGTLATVAVAAGTLLAFVWPYAAVLHDVAIDTAGKGTDLRLLAGWDTVAPYSLAFSALPRIFFMLAIVLALRLTESSPWLQRTGVAIVAISAIGTATTLTGAAFPALAIGSLGYELWVGALAWRWLRDDTRAIATDS